MPSPLISKPSSQSKVDRRLTSPDTFHENDTITASYSGNDVETGKSIYIDVVHKMCTKYIFGATSGIHALILSSIIYAPNYNIIGVVTSGYLATGALSGDEDRPYLVKNVDDGETLLPTSAELRSKKRRIGWMIFGTVMLGFILVIGLVFGLQKPRVIVDPIGLGNETEESVDVVVDVEEPVFETLVDEQQPMDGMDDEDSGGEEVDVPLFEDSAISLGSSEDVDSSNDVSSDVSSPVGVKEEVVEDEEAEDSSPSFNLDTTNAIDNEEEEEETTSTHDHNHAHVGSNDIVSSGDTSDEQHDDESNNNPFEPEVTIGDAALLNQISSEGNGTTTASPSSSPTKSPVTSEPTMAPTNEVRNVVGVFCAYLMFISCDHISTLCISHLHNYQSNNAAN